MSEFVPNSHKYREEQKDKVVEKRAKKVVSGSVTTKKNNVRKLTDIFIAEDAKQVKSYVVMDVLVPAIKKAIFDIVTDGVDMILYGETGRGSRRKSGSNTPYHRFSDDRDRRRSESRSYGRFDYEDLVFDRRSDAEAVLDEMGNILDQYGIVTVADMYEAADRSCPYTSNKYGWTSLRSAEIVRVRDGFVIKLSKAVALD